MLTVFTDIAKNLKIYAFFVNSQLNSKFGRNNEKSKIYEELRQEIEEVFSVFLKIQKYRFRIYLQ